MHVCVYIYVYISFHSGTQSSMMIVIIVSMYIIVSDTPRRYIKDARNVVGHGLFFFGFHGITIDNSPSPYLLSIDPRFVVLY